jgi:hypothetical protein
MSGVNNNTLTIIFEYIIAVLIKIRIGQASPIRILQ